MTNYNYNSTNNYYKTENAKKIFKKILKNYNSNDSQKNTQAKEEAITFLNGLSYYVIKNHFSEYMSEHLTELLQEGSIGILKGLQHYKVELGAPSTFFYWYIKHEMQTYVDETILQTSEYYSVNIKKVKAAISRICQEKENYTIEDIKKDTKLSKKTISQVLKIMYYENNVYYEDETKTIQNLISKANYINTENLIIEKERNEFIHKILSETLTQTEFFIITNLMGMNQKGNILKYSEIARLLNLSPAKVKRISDNIIKKLKKSDLYLFYKD